MIIAAASRSASWNPTRDATFPRQVGLDVPSRIHNPEDGRTARMEDAMPDFTPYQQKIIKRYYNNQDTLKLQRLAELVSELYLSEGKKRQRVWSQIVAAMKVLGVPASRIEHLRQQDNPAQVAEVVKELEGKK
jgi:hypothetical protein